MSGEYNVNRNILLGAISYIFFTYFSLNFYSEVLPIGLFVTGGIVVTGLFAFLIFRFLFVKRRISDLLIALSIAGILAIISDAVINRIKLKDTQERADLLVAVLEVYKNQYGEYPDSLDDLVAQSLIDKVPGTAFGNGQYYYDKKISGDTIIGYQYTLKYYAPLGMEASYFSSKGEWFYDD